MKYWYFGNFGQFKYNLKESDKYLVEAKTLFEYGQFLSASLALEKSDKYFQKTPLFLIKAKGEGKNISQNRGVLVNASVKHIEILSKLLHELPNEVEWRPEKEKPVLIHIGERIKNSISIRKSIYE